MNEEFFDALDMLHDKTGIPKDYIKEKVELAITAAYKKDNLGNGNLKVVLDEERKELRVFQLKEVVEDVEDPTLQIDLESSKKYSKRYKIGSTAEIEIKPKNFGRISAQNAKQVIIQAIREAERGILIREFEGKRDEMISATVYKIDPQNGNIILDIGKGEAALTRAEQIPGERIREGERLKIYVADIKNQPKGPLITLSRRHPGLVKRLFEMEVPELNDGTIEIRAIAREAGIRTKMAVSSENPNVDPVGSCIGARGARINAVVRQLNNEKIDVIRYSDDPAEYIRAALAAAETIDIMFLDDKSCRVIVPDGQLSLAIGKEGQNARLAAKLTGFKIDIKTPSMLEF